MCAHMTLEFGPPGNGNFTILCLLVDVNYVPCSQCYEIRRNIHKLLLQYIHIYIFILLRRVALQLKLVFKGPFDKHQLQSMIITQTVNWIQSNYKSSVTKLNARKFKKNKVNHKHITNTMHIYIYIYKYILIYINIYIFIYINMYIFTVYTEYIKMQSGLW